MNMLGRSYPSNYGPSGSGQPVLLDEQSIDWSNALLNHPISPPPQISSDWVCDRCISKKVKCDLQRPACTRCREVGLPCVYSCTKRKPGPPKGKRRKIGSSRTNTERLEGSSSFLRVPTESSQIVSAPGEGLVSQQASPPQADLTGRPSPLTHTPRQFVQTTPPPNRLNSEFSYNDPQLNPSEERELLDNFFKYIQPSLPLFRRGQLFHQYECGLVSRDLLLTILAVSAKILGPASLWTDHGLENCLQSLLDTNAVEEQSPDALLSLDIFKGACLLAFYEFHQYPASKAWMRIGQLARKAYQCGLHQIDNREQNPVFDSDPVSDEVAEEWRYVWWCIYCLDSYSNVTASTPFVVETASVKTALVTASVSSVNNGSAPASKIFLSDETDLLWKTVKEITSQGGNVNFNFHILTTTILREAATLHRLRAQNPSERLRRRLAALEDHISAVRLALPARYLDAARNVFINESSAEHHARLICVLHLHLSRVLIALPSELQQDATEWMRRWHQTLEYCEDIVTVVKQWDGQFSTSVDPAVCFIIYTALVLVHLHSKCESSSQPELQARIVSYSDVLLLFLEQFSSFWYLPRSLTMSFDKFSQLYPGHLTPEDIEHILRQFQAPLHQKWLKLLSPSSGSSSLPTAFDIDSNLFVGDWDFSNWEAPADFPSAESIMALLNQTS